MLYVSCDCCGNVYIDAKKVAIHRVLDGDLGWEAVYNCPNCHSCQVVTDLDDLTVDRFTGAGAHNLAPVGVGPAISEAEIQDFAERIRNDDHVASAFYVLNARC